MNAEPVAPPRMSQRRRRAGRQLCALESQRRVVVDHLALNPRRPSGSNVCGTAKTLSTAGWWSFWAFSRCPTRMTSSSFATGAAQGTGGSPHSCTSSRRGSRARSSPYRRGDCPRDKVDLNADSEGVCVRRRVPKHEAVTHGGAGRLLRTDQPVLTTGFGGMSVPTTTIEREPLAEPQRTVRRLARARHLRKRPLPRRLAGSGTRDAETGLRVTVLVTHGELHDDPDFAATATRYGLP